MKIIATGFPGTDEPIQVEASSGLIEAAKEAGRERSENPERYFRSMAEFQMDQLRRKKGKDYNSKLIFIATLNGDYRPFLKKLLRDEIEEDYKEKVVEKIPTSIKIFKEEDKKRPPPYLVEVAEDRIMRD